MEDDAAVPRGVVPSVTGAATAQAHERMMVGPFVRREGDRLAPIPPPSLPDVRLETRI